MITNECLHYFLGLTRSLQQEAKDIVQAVSEVTTLTSTLEEVRENVDSYHSEWFKTVSDMCGEVGTTPSMPRICGRQRHRASTPASSPSEYFRRIITVPVLDHLLAELNTRFGSHQKTALQGLHLVPSLLVKESLATVTNKVLEVGQLYEVDLPSVSALKSELHQMEVYGERMAVLHFLLLSLQLCRRSPISTPTSKL